MLVYCGLIKGIILWRQIFHSTFYHSLLVGGRVQVYFPVIQKLHVEFVAKR